MNDPREILRTLLGQRIVAYHPILAKIMGSASHGIWLSQILYWDKVKSGEWFYKSAREIIGETGITEREAKTAKVWAVKLGIVDVQVKGLPRVTHYHINYEVLYTLIERANNSDIEASNKSDTVVQLNGHPRLTIETPLSNNSGQSPIQNIPQTTTETTTETTTKENKHPYGGFGNVLLSDSELKKLQERFGEYEAWGWIDELSHAIESKGYKYKSHYATILNWNRRNEGGNNGTHRGHPEKGSLKDSIGKPLS